MNPHWQCLYLDDIIFMILGYSYVKSLRKRNIITVENHYEPENRL